MRLQNKIPNANGVAGGSTATWDLPIGRRYHQLDIEYSGVTLAQMTEIRIVANGEVIHRLSGTERDALNAFDRRVAGGGILAVPFDRDNLFSQAGEELTAIQTGSQDPETGVAITTFKLEIDFAAGSTPVISVTATQSDNDPRVPGTGWIIRTLKFPKTLSIVGENEVSDIPKNTEGPRKYRWINRIAFKSANTNRVTIERDNLRIFERSSALNTRRQADGVRTAQAGFFVVDFLEEGYDFEAMNLVNMATGYAYQDVRYKLNLTAAETVTAIVEYIGRL